MFFDHIPKRTGLPPRVVGATDFLNEMACGSAAEAQAAVPPPRNAFRKVRAGCRVRGPKNSVCETDVLHRHLLWTVRSLSLGEEAFQPPCISLAKKIGG